MRSVLKFAVALLPIVLLFAEAAPAQRAAGRPKPSATAAKVGSAVRWRTDMAAALADARASFKPVFWYVPTVPGTHMDRKDLVDLYARAGMLSMPDVVEMLNRRTVPVMVAVDARRPAAETKALFDRFGVTPGAFIEPGFVLLKTDSEAGDAFFKLDRLTTMHELWLTSLLERELTAAGFDVPKADADEIASGKLKPLEIVERQLALGKPAWALGSLEKFADAFADDASKARATLLRGKALARLGEAKAAGETLAQLPKGGEAAVERGLLALRNDDEAAALKELAGVTQGPRADEARLYKGAALWRLGKRDEARDAWMRLAADKPESPAGWKAAAEAEGFGPFARGFEEFGYLPADALGATPEGTQRARTETDSAWLARRGVEYLLKMQGPNGGFDDSNYDFGGRDSLPDVYVAVTAIAGRALVAWRDVDPARVDAAVKKAFAYCADESNCATKNRQERMWAHAYRVLFFGAMKDAGLGDAAKLKAKTQEIVGLMEGLQNKGGAWFHEYPNPFVTALAIHALHDARKHGARIDPAIFDRGADSLRSTRDEAGSFSYGTPARGGTNVIAAAGRNPQAEFALKLAGKSDDAAIIKAVERSFEHHGAFESVRKYDDHAAPYQIGGFFYYYDEMHRADAIASLADPALRGALFAKQRAILLAIPEIDGRFMDSHELGKPYGTAAGLLCLKATEPGRP